MMLQSSAAAAGRDEMVALLAGRAAGAWAGDYRVDDARGRSVYTSAAQIRAWDGTEGTLPARATVNLWGEEVRRRHAAADLVARLRAAVAPAVAAGLLREREASGIVYAAERAVLGGAEAGMLVD